MSVHFFFVVWLVANIHGSWISPSGGQAPHDTHPVKKKDLLLSLPLSPGEPQALNQVLTMLQPADATSSTLQLVANDMTDIMEKLDSRELDLGDGDYDTTDANVTSGWWAFML